MEDISNPLSHIAIIMDGNGRWAKKRNLPRTHGHIEGVKRVEEIVQAASEMGIKVLTLYAFSTENWTRPEDEVSMLMRTLISVLNKKIRRLNKANIKLQFIGRKEGIPKAVLKTIDSATQLTKNNTGMILNVAFNYGGRIEILDAVKKIATEVNERKIKVSNINEDVFNEALYTKGLPDPDLLIRTSGEQRLSGFLIWQSAYSELVFMDVFWPEFRKIDFMRAIRTYQRRKRKYGR